MLNHLIAITACYLVFRMGMEYGVDRHYKNIRKKKAAERAKLPRVRR